MHKLLHHVTRHGIRVPLHPELDANFVDYELSPIRTTGSEYENGIRSQGGGGVDILLTNAVDRLPVVVEVKGATDQNLLLGLIQSLTYAVEFSTLSQRERMMQIYPEQFAWYPDGPALDIYLLLAGTPKSRHHPAFLGLVDGICSEILVPGTAVARMVRRIACLSSESTTTGDVSYSVAFVHPGAA